MNVLVMQWIRNFVMIHFRHQYFLLKFVFIWFSSLNNKNALSFGILFSWLNKSELSFLNLSNISHKTSSVTISMLFYFFNWISLRLDLSNIISGLFLPLKWFWIIIRTYWLNFLLSLSANVCSFLISAISNLNATVFVFGLPFATF